jgi:hypothetical protein
MFDIKGDLDLVILQIKNKFACKSERLRRYRNAIWDTMENFDALDLVAIPRDQNLKADELPVVASTLQLSQDLMDGNVKVEVIFRRSVSDNVDHWQIFDDDKQVIKFLNNIQEFSDFHTSEKEEGCNYTKNDQKINPVPRSLVAQEQLFDREDGHKPK